MPTIDHPYGDIEYQRYPGNEALPTAVFLHEGLGSIAQWGRLPALFSQLTSMPALVYSRHGYGGSGGTRERSVDYLHREALEVLPSVLDALSISLGPVLVGHSDGATIAAIYAATHAVTAAILIAPHIVVEECTLDGIRTAQERFDDNIAASLAPFHDDPAELFAHWADVWLSPQFRSFDVTPLLPSITDPVLVMQGEVDNFGSLRQVDLVQQHVSGPVRTVVLAGIAHHPHLETLEETSEHLIKFATEVTSGHGYPC